MKTAYQIADQLEERNAPYEDDTANFIRQQQAEIEALRNQLWELKSEPWGFDRHPVKEAKYGITTKWDGITTYHETTEPIGKANK